MTWTATHPHAIEVRQRANVARGVFPMRLMLDLWEDGRAIYATAVIYEDSGTTPIDGRIPVDELRATLRRHGIRLATVTTAMRKVEGAIYARGAALLAARKGT